MHGNTKTHLEDGDKQGIFKIAWIIAHWFNNNYKALLQPEFIFLFCGRSGNSKKREFMRVKLSVMEGARKEMLT